MEWLKYTALVLASFLIVSGLVALAMTWLAPRMLDTRFMQGMLTGQRLEPTRRNRTLASASSVVFGTYLWLSIHSFVVPALLVLAVLVMVAPFASRDPWWANARLPKEFLRFEAVGWDMKDKVVQAARLVGNKKTDEVPAEAGDDK